MKVIENTNVFPPHKYFVEVEEKFLKFTPNCRVLPARYFSEPQLHFSLKRKYEPGEHKHFPNGGFEVCDTNGGIYNFDLDEVVVHPFHLNMLKYFTTSESVKDKEKVSTGIKGKRGRPKLPDDQKKTFVKYVPTGGKRGRKPLDPTIKALREAESLNKKEKSGGKRGRKPLDPAVKAAREVERLEKQKKNPSGKRGRPKKHIS